MNKRFNKKLLLSAILIMLFALTGCGGALNTELTVNDDLSGKRVMTYTADCHDQDSYFKGDYASARSVIAKSCPDGLKLDDRSTDDNIELVFTLEFSDIDEYTHKVRSIIEASGKDAPETPIEYMAPSSVFATGISYKENFTSEDLMNWFQDTLVNGGYVSSGDRGNIYYKGKNYQNNICGNEDTSSRVNINTISYLALNGISYTTGFNSDGTFDREIRVDVPQASMDLKEDEIKEFLESSASGKISSDWSFENGVNVCTLTGTGLSASEMDEWMDSFYGENGDWFSVMDAEEDDDDDEEDENAIPNYFEDRTRVVENFRFDNYVSNQYNEVNFTYNAPAEGQYDGKYKTGDNEHTLYTYPGSGSDESMQLFTSYTTSVEADYVYTHSFFMDSAEITLNVKRKGITRNVKLNFGTLSDERRQRLSSDLEAAMPEKGMKLKSCEANENNGVTVEIETESSDSDDSELYKSVFGVSNKLAVSRSSKAPLAASRITNVDDRFDLSRFASGNIPSVTYTIKGVGKELKFNKDSDKKKDKDEGEDKEASDTITREGKNYVRTYTDLDAGTRLENNVTGTTSNFFAILLWIVTAALIAFAAYRIFLFVKEAAANRPAKPAPAAGAAQPPYGVAMPQGSNPFAAAAPQTQQPGNNPFAAGPAVQPENTSSEAQPAAEPGNSASAGAAQMKPESAVRFCANCGNKLDADAKFCDSCGTPVE